ncbi:MAG: chemotaxis protein CheA, partial [Planctomyces sp.]
LNLVGELVLQKNRVNAMSRHIQAMNLGSQEFREQAGEVSGGLDRVTSDLQLAVMKTRMQPLDKIFGKYPRLIRDLAAKLGKKINLVIEGGETEVDKSVIEQLGDPLIHLMRNSCDHGLESPADRAAAGKSEVGTIRLSASNAGGHVEIRIADDGRGLNTKRISQKAIEKGLYTQAQIDQMSEQELCRIIFLPGFSTAEKISDVSGRGVGMDVVRSNIEKVKGTIDLINDPGKGCTVLIKIPLTVAIMSAMMVGVGPETYAVPLSSIVEIVRPEKDQLASINQSPVMRLRDTVLPLLQAAELFSLPASKRDDAPFAVVLSLSERRVGLMVSRLIGQQEVVIKPLDEELSRTGAGGPVSGATVRDDGGVSLIVDVPRLFELAEAEPRR